MEVSKPSAPMAAAAAARGARLRSRPSVLVLYTGGTIGMMEDADGSLQPRPGLLAAEMARMPELQQDDMPAVEVHEYEDLVDSSDMDAADWAKVARDIGEAYYRYDGFVVLLGTDTMAYVASALAFMLENLGKPVVLTGSMIPLAKGYSDARRNLLVAAQIAGHSCIPEVCIFFFDKLLRGCRSKKMNTGSLNAFASPNYPPLASVGVAIHYHESRHLAPPRKPFRVHLRMDAGVVALRLLPGFDDQVFAAIAANDAVKALIVESYGTGNAPSRKLGLLHALQAFTDAGKLLVVVSQCLTGPVDLLAYSVGRRLADIGAISAQDMTVECVATKLSYLFGRGLTVDEVRTQIANNLRGEVSPPVADPYNNRYARLSRSQL